MQDCETLGLDCTQSATGEEQYIETSRAGRGDVATSKPQGSVGIERGQNQKWKTELLQKISKLEPGM